MEKKKDPLDELILTDEQSHYFNEGIKVGEFRKKRELEKAGLLKKEKQKKKKVICDWCEKKLGSVKKNTFDIIKTAIQEERKGNYPLNFCSVRCQKNYHSYMKRLNNAERRLEDLEKGLFERKIEILNKQGDLHSEFKRYMLKDRIFEELVDFLIKKSNVEKAKEVMKKK